MRLEYEYYVTLTIAYRQSPSNLNWLGFRTGFHRPGLVLRVELQRTSTCNQSDRCQQDFKSLDLEYSSYAVLNKMFNRSITEHYE